jgi:hypothetical protein
VIERLLLRIHHLPTILRPTAEPSSSSSPQYLMNVDSRSPHDSPQLPPPPPPSSTGGTSRKIGLSCAECRRCDSGFGHQFRFVGHCSPTIDPNSNVTGMYIGRSHRTSVVERVSAAYSPVSLVSGKPVARRLCLALIFPHRRGCAGICPEGSILRWFTDVSLMSLQEHSLQQRATSTPLATRHATPADFGFQGAHGPCPALARASQNTYRRMQRFAGAAHSGGYQA